MSLSISIAGSSCQIQVSKLHFCPNTVTVTIKTKSAHLSCKMCTLGQPDLHWPTTTFLLTVKPLRWQKQVCKFPNPKQHAELHWRIWMKLLLNLHSYAAFRQLGAPVSPACHIFFLQISKSTLESSRNDITPITCCCHANIVPSTGQENNIALEPKADKCPSSMSHFFTI